VEQRGGPDADPLQKIGRAHLRHWEPFLDARLLGDELGLSGEDLGQAVRVRDVVEASPAGVGDGAEQLLVNALT
jgi:hypothetical protein